MVEPLLSGIVLGLVPVTAAGLFVTAYLQYRRGDQASFSCDKRLTIVARKFIAGSWKLLRKFCSPIKQAHTS
jgi:cytochrome b6-f complex subunit 5